MTATLTPNGGGRVPLWRDVRVLQWLFQLLVVAVAAAIVIWLYGNYTTNAESQGIPTNFDFLDNPAAFEITGNEMSQSAPVRDAFVQGFLKDQHRVCPECGSSQVEQRFTGFMMGSTGVSSSAASIPTGGGCGHSGFG